MAAIEPMEQFLVKPIVELPPVTLPGLGTVNLFSINNSVLFMMIAAVIIVGFMMLASKRDLVPGRLQAAGEGLYNLIDGTLTGGIIGDRGRPFLPFVMTLFLFIAILNFLGLTPVVGFTATSQLAVTVTLAVLTFSIVLIVGFAKNGLGFFKLFWPSNMNFFMAAFLCVIEFISFIIRQPVTDPTSGFRASSRRTIDLCSRLYPHDYPEPEALVMLHRAGLKLREIPVTMNPRYGGTSSITPIKACHCALFCTAIAHQSSLPAQ